MNDVTKIDAAYMLDIKNISSWDTGYLNAEHSAQTSDFKVVLPAIQRGKVWRAAQIEGLWDSLLRGFPVGSFIATPFKAERGTKSDKNNDKSTPSEHINTPTYHLLDGQQRSSTIALGFYDAWKKELKDAKVALWIDLLPPENNTNREFNVRMVSRTHPWGYSSLQDGRDDKRLALSDIRNASHCYRDASPNLTGKKPQEFPLMYTWPWDSHAAIPIPLLIAAIERGNKNTNNSDCTKEELLKLLSDNLPYWNTKEKVQNINTIKTENYRSWLYQLENACTDKYSQESKLLDKLIYSFRRILPNTNNEYPGLKIPFIVFNEENKENNEKKDNDESKDVIEDLFIRVNSSGTVLAGEEMMYSILKSTWPEAINHLENIENPLTSPAKQLLLSSYIVMRRVDNNNKNTPPPPLNVKGFRNIVHNRNEKYKNFSAELKQFMKDEQKDFISDTLKLLSDSNKSFTLCRPLLPSITDGDKGRDILLLLYAWQDKLRSAKLGVKDLLEDQHRRLLGFVTALAWLSVDTRSALDAIWPKLCLTDGEDLLNFFNTNNFYECVKINKKGQFPVLPPITPEHFEKIINALAIDKLENADIGSYKDSNSWQGFNHSEIWLIPKNREEELKLLLEGNSILKYALQDANDDFSIANNFEKLQRYWDVIGRKITRHKDFLIYAQREYITQWFPSFDPTTPDSVKEVNRPWDYDHIHAANYIASDTRRYKATPEILAHWHNHNGNFRAWPLELNRSDSDHSIKVKFEAKNEVDSQYNLADVNKKILASAIDPESFDGWKSLIPDNSVEIRYLEGNRDGMFNLLTQINQRTVYIYKQWFDELRIIELIR